MNRLVLVLALGASLLVGCFPQELVVWSPDGKAGAVVDGKAGELRLCDPDGKLSDPQAESVTRAQWLPDSRRLAVVRELSAQTWQEVAAIMDKPAAEALIKKAKTLKAEILASEPWDPEKSKAMEDLGPEGLLAIMYLRDEDSAGLPEKLAEHWEQIKELSSPYSVIELWQAEGLTAKAGPRVCTMIQSPADLRVSPTGEWASLIINYEPGDGQQQQQSTGQLWIVALQENSKPMSVGKDAAVHPDWSAEGMMSISILAGPEGEGPRTGALMATNWPNGQPTKLADTLFADQNRVRCLDDGRIVFSAPIEMKTAETPPEGSEPAEVFGLYVFDASKEPKVQPIALPEGMSLQAGVFEPSPDGKRLALLTGEGVSILDLDSRTTITVRETTWPEQMIPAVPLWRTNEELCITIPPGDAPATEKRGQIVLWSAPDKVRVLSQDWPDEAIPSLVKPEEGPQIQMEPIETQPATQEGF